MRAFIVVVLVALFAVTMAADKLNFKKIGDVAKKALPIAKQLAPLFLADEKIAQLVQRVKDAKPKVEKKVRDAKTKVNDIKERVEKAKSKVRDCKKRAEAAQGKLVKARETLKNLKGKINKPAKKNKTESDLFSMLLGMGAKFALSKLSKGKKQKGVEQQTEEAPKQKKSKKSKKSKNAEQSDAEFKKFLGKLKNIAGKASGIIGKVSGVIGKVSPVLNQFAPKLGAKVDKFGGKIDKVGGILGMFTQADAEFLDKLEGYINQGKSIYAAGKSIASLFKRKSKKNKKQKQPQPEPQPEAQPEADSDATRDCGMAFQNGQQLGNKQCVLVQGKPVVVETAIAFERMNAAAKAAGITLQVNSGFRTQKEQEYLYGCYKSKKCNNGNLAARPGFSNHQNGRAMDISCSNPKVFQWMSNNASKFGFIRTVPSENWHWELLPGRGCASTVKYACK